MSENKLPQNPTFKHCPNCHNNLFLWNYGVKSRWVCFGCFTCWEVNITDIKGELLYFQPKISRIKVDKKDNVKAIESVKESMVIFENLLKEIQKDGYSFDVNMFLVSVRIFLRLAEERADYLTKKYK